MVPNERTALVSTSSTEPIKPDHHHEANKTLYNFILMSILYSANHGCVVSCLGLASARLGSIGAWQSGVLYLFYTASAILGATYVAKTLGSRNTILLGMTFYNAYVGCFMIATQYPSVETPVALLAAAIGGIGGGLMWTAQGSYFSTSAHRYAELVQKDGPQCTSLFAGLFAFVYLVEEVVLHLMSTVLLPFGISWAKIFTIYAIVAITATFGMVLVRDYTSQEETQGTTTLTTAPNNNHKDGTKPHHICFKVTSTLRLLYSDPKMKYMIGLTSVFGFSASFLNSYVNSHVLKVALNDTQSRYIGVLSALSSAVAALFSMVFGILARTFGKGPFLVLGAMAFFCVAFPFLLFPNVASWGLGKIMAVYVFEGIGRATFEGSLRGVFGDYFQHDKEGAFANIILQNGLASAIGYVLSFRLTCKEPSTYCVAYSDGSLHDVLSFELLVCGTAVVAVLGFWRASWLYKREPLEDARSSDLKDKLDI